MSAIVTTALLIILLPLVHIPSAAGDDLEDAVAAYSQADYTKAVNLAWPLAESGNADAQYLLGMAYMDGNGVTKDLVESYKWYELVVHAGDADAEIDCDDVAGQLKPDDLTDAEKHADEWAPQ